MSQFSVYANKGKGSEEFPYLLDLQSTLLSKHLATTIVAPLVHRKTLRNLVIRLHVPISLKNKEYVVLFDQLAAVDSRRLGAPLLTMNEKYSEQFKKALDVLFFNYP